MKYVIFLLMIFSILSSCNRILNPGTGKPNRPGTSKIPGGNSTPAPTGKESALVKEAGVRRYFLNVDGDNRTFLVQLPKGYSASIELPCHILFSFHQGERHKLGEKSWSQRLYR